METNKLINKSHLLLAKINDQLSLTDKLMKQTKVIIEENYCYMQPMHDAMEQARSFKALSRKQLTSFLPKNNT